MHDLSTKIEPAIAAIIRNVDVAATALGIEYFLCGAMARYFVVEHICGMANRRATQDLDFGISIRSWEEFENLKTQLIRVPGYSQDTKMEQRIRAGGLWFDMVPFGVIEIGSILQERTRAQITAILDAQSAASSNAYPLVEQMLGGLIPMDRTESEVEKQIELLRCLRRGIDDAI